MRNVACDPGRTPPCRTRTESVSSVTSRTPSASTALARSRFVYRSKAVACDRDQDRTRQFDAAEAKRSDKAGSLADLVKRLAPPRAVWVMLPAGAITEGTIKELAGLLQPGDTVIDGGNTMFKDDVRRAA